MAEVPPRYLVAYLDKHKRDRLALLRFPPGVTLEDAGFDWGSAPEDDIWPTIPRGVLGRLSGLGIEVVATGEKAAGQALRRARAPRSSLDAFAGDYLGLNARLGGWRHVTAREYAMDTEVEGGLLRYALLDYLRQRRGVRVYGDAAFRARDIPGTLRPRLIELVDLCWNECAQACVPCRLHGGWEECGDFYNPSQVIYLCARKRSMGVRVTVPRRLLDELDTARIRGDGRRFARAARAVARITLDSLPGDAWESRYSGVTLVDWNRYFASLVASAMAKTCEEYKMLLEALEKCRSPRDVVWRARDASWVVSRTLENLRDRW